MEMLGAVNVDVEQKDTKLIITIDTSKEYGASKSGKSTTIASTLGNKVVAMPNGEQVTVGLNVYKPRRTV